MLESRPNQQRGRVVKTALLLLALSMAAHANELLFENIGCNEDPTAESYEARIEPLKAAFRTGRQVRVYMKRVHDDGSAEEYFTELTAGRFDENVVYALLPLRPYIDGHARVTRPDALLMGGLNSLGLYWHGVYVVDAKPGKMAAAECFDIRWFGN